MSKARYRPPTQPVSKPNRYAPTTSSSDDVPAARSEAIIPEVLARPAPAMLALDTLLSRMLSVSAQVDPHAGPLASFISSLGAKLKIRAHTRVATGYTELTSQAVRVAGNITQLQQTRIELVALCEQERHAPAIARKQAEVVLATLDAMIAEAEQQARYARQD